MTRHVHLVGSVPLADARAVFETVSAALGPHLKTHSRRRDRRTARLDHLARADLRAAPGVRAVGRDLPAARRARAQGPPLQAQGRRRGRERTLRQSLLRRHGPPLLRRLRRAEARGRDSADLQAPGRPGAGAFGDLALCAGGPAPRRRSDLQRRGAARDRQDRGRHPARRARHPIRRRLGGVRPARAQPAVELRHRPSRRCRRRFADILLRLANHVPADIDLLFHFCYGDAGHKHVVEPTDMGDMVDFANRLATRIARPIQLVHMPVPRDRTDEAYFAPLSRLTAAAGDRALPRPGAPHRRRRRHPAASRRRPKIVRATSPSPPSAASAGATPPPSPSCCVSTPRSPPATGE